MNFKEKVYGIIEVSSGGMSLSSVYDIFMIGTITISIIPLMFKETNSLLSTLDFCTASIFIIDYLLRWWTAPLKYQDKKSYFYYPFTFTALCDLVSILPSFTIINQGFKLLRLFRLFRAFRVLRVFKMFKYSKNCIRIVTVIRKEKHALYAVGSFAFAYIILSALIAFNFEPDTFETFFDALYWATVSLTTVGYGDIYPTTTIGRIITMISSLIGIAIVALPAGIITSGYMEELNSEK